MSCMSLKHRNGRTTSRRFVPGSPGELAGTWLEGRSLTAVPVFVRTSPFDSLYTTEADSYVPRDDGGQPEDDVVDTSPTPGADMSSQAQGSFQGFTNTAAGSVLNTAAVPTGPTSDLRGIIIYVDQNHLESGWTGGGVAGFVTQTTIASGHDAWQMNETDGSTLSGTITVNFTLSVSGTSFGTGRQFNVHFASSFLDFDASDGNLTVDDGDGTVLNNDPTFAANGAAGSYTIQYTIPVIANITMDYSSFFQTWATGWRNGVTGDSPSLSWSISLASNP